MRLSPRSPKPPRSRYMLPYALLILGAISLSCSKDPFGPEVTDSPAVPPRVISVSPANASVGPYDQTVVWIEFNKVMNDSSLKKAVSLVEPGAGARIDTSECWLYGRRWGIGGLRDLDRQIPQYRVGQTYRLVIGSEARDMTGNRLQPFYYEFTPEPYFRMKATPFTSSPATSGGWDCWFNSPVDSSFYHYVEINPPVNARWVEEDGWYWHWHIEGSNLTPGQTYTLTIRAGAHDRFGNPLENAAVQALVVGAIAPAAGAR